MIIISKSMYIVIYHLKHYNLFIFPFKKTIGVVQ